jgi:hypothetical protein
MFWRRKKQGRPVDGPRLDLDLPKGDWSASTLAFHKRVNQVVSVIMADDEAVLDPLPIIDPGPLSFKPNWIDRADKDIGAKFKTDIEGERGYLLRFAYVSWEEALEVDRDAYVEFYDAWAAKHLETGLMRRFTDQDGVQHGWQLDTDDVIGVRLEGRNGELSVSATRAWIDERDRNEFK